MSTIDTKCVACGAKGASPSPGSAYPFCHECEKAWRDSPERARAAAARDDFIRRRAKELR